MKKLILLLLLIPSLANAAGDIPATYPRTYRDYPNTTTPQTSVSLNNEVNRSRRLVISEDKDVTAPPITCNNTYNGYTYLLTAAGTGGWAGNSSGTIMICTFQDGSASWLGVTPKEGFLSYVNDEDALYYFDGSAWSGIPLGVPTTVTVTANTTTNEENKLVFMADTAASGVVALEADTIPTYNPSTGTLTATIFAGTADSATGWFTSGAVEQDYGGIGADISAYAGLIGTTLGTPSQVDESSEVASFISDETGSGALVFGTSPTIATPVLTLPDANGDAPTADGVIEYDRTAETLEVGDGAATKLFYPTGTMTNAKYCIYTTGTGIVCNSDGAVHDALTFDATISNLLGLTGANQVLAAVDAGADSIMFWDDAGGAADYFAIGAGVEDFLTTPSSANLATAVTDETGTGALVFGTDPVITDSITMPNGAAPTTNATAEIALDTTITDHQPLWQYYDGAENMTIIAIDTAELPALDDEIVKYNAATDKFVLEADAGGVAASLTGANSETIANGTDDYWIFTSVGGANNEDLRMNLDYAANKVAIDSTTGTTQLLIGGTSIVQLGLYDGDSHFGVFDVADLAGEVVYTLPASTTNIVGHDTADTLTNKTLSAANNVIEADTVVTIAGLAPNTATTATAQPNITSASNLTTVGTLTTLSVDNININGNTITSTDANGNITITPNGTGDIVLGKTLDTNTNSIQLNVAPADNTCHGIIISDTVNDIVEQGDILYFKSNGEWDLADFTVEAEASATLGMAGADCVAGACVMDIVLNGICRNATDLTLTTGSLLYLGTDGFPVSTRPSGSGDFVRYVGWVPNTDHIYFNPSAYHIEVP